jgi:dTDP-4-dehydrorhamnose 3,5-epimerase
MPFEFEHLRIPGLVSISPRVFPDSRGFLLEWFKKSDFEAHGVPGVYPQDLHSHSTKGVLRGMHYQIHPSAQGKMVRVVKGEVYDVAVDIREGSPTFGEWEGIVLSEKNFRMLYVPVGFAHGFCVLSEEAEFVYKVTHEFDPDCDAGFVWNDPEVGIEWPMANPVLSDKDAELPPLADADRNFEFEG